MSATQTKPKRTPLNRVDPVRGAGYVEPVRRPVAVEIPYREPVVRVKRVKVPVRRVKSFAKARQREAKLRVGLLTPEYQKQIADAAMDTWQAIGCDILQANACNSQVFGGGECVTSPRDQVLEVVLDHIRTYGRGVDFTQFEALSYEVKVALVGAAFTDDEYGY